MKKIKKNEIYLYTMVKLFYEQLDDHYYPYPLCSNEEIENFIEKSQKEIKIVAKKKIDMSLNVGLLGSPTFFKSIRKKLLDKGFNVNCYFIPYHSDKRVKLLFNNKLAFWLFCLIKGVRFSFRKLNYRNYLGQFAK